MTIMVYLCIIIFHISNSGESIGMRHSATWTRFPLLKTSRGPLITPWLVRFGGANWLYDHIFKVFKLFPSCLSFPCCLSLSYIHSVSIPDLLVFTCKMYGVMNQSMALCWTVVPSWKSCSWWRSQWLMHH